MTREIKFRIWDGKTFLQDKLILNNAFLNWPKLLRYVPKDSKIQQYTGLKDKNDKEIYEGDIVILTGNYANTKKLHCEIICYSGCFKAFEGFLGWCVSDIASRNIEVIGNIYKNPELLRGQNENHK